MTIYRFETTTIAAANVESPQEAANRMGAAVLQAPDGRAPNGHVTPERFIRSNEDVFIGTPGEDEIGDWSYEVINGTQIRIRSRTANGEWEVGHPVDINSFIEDFATDFPYVLSGGEWVKEYVAITTELLRDLSYGTPALTESGEKWTVTAPRGRTVRFSRNPDVTDTDHMSFVKNDGTMWGSEIHVSDVLSIRNPDLPDTDFSDADLPGVDESDE